MSYTPTTNVAMVLKEFMLRIQGILPAAKIVYDNDLSYASAVEKLRAKNNQNSGTQNMFPMLVFKRTPLRPAHNFIGERGAKQINPRHNVSDTLVDNYRSSQSEFEIQFTYYVNSVELGEEFEISYLAETGLSGIEEVSVDLGAPLDTHIYSFEWKDLDDFTLNNTDSYYAAYSSTINCVGWFFLLSSIQGKPINTINADVIGNDGVGSGMTIAVSATDVFATTPVDGGRGYSIGDRATVVDTGASASTICVVEVTAVSDGVVDTVTIITAGVGYTSVGTEETVNYSTGETYATMIIT